MLVARFCPRCAPFLRELMLSLPTFRDGAKPPNGAQGRHAATPQASARRRNSGARNTRTPRGPGSRCSQGPEARALRSVVGALSAACVTRGSAPEARGARSRPMGCAASSQVHPLAPQQGSNSAHSSSASRQAAAAAAPGPVARGRRARPSPPPLAGWPPRTGAASKTDATSPDGGEPARRHSGRGDSPSDARFFSPPSRSGALNTTQPASPAAPSTAPMLQRRVTHSVPESPELPPGHPQVRSASHPVAGSGCPFLAVPRTHGGEKRLPRRASSPFGPEDVPRDLLTHQEIETLMQSVRESTCCSACSLPAPAADELGRVTHWERINLCAFIPQQYAPRRLVHRPNRWR